MRLTTDNLGKSAWRKAAGAVSLLLLAALLGLSAASASAAEFGFTAFDGQVDNEAGEPETRAGAHPWAASTTFAVETHPVELLPGLFAPHPVEDIENVRVELPPGLVGNPRAVPTQCTAAELAAAANTPGPGPNVGCPVSSQVGIIEVVQPANTEFAPVFSMVPPPNRPASFGFNIAGTVVRFHASVGSSSDYAVVVDSLGIAQALPVLRAKVTLWGIPADSSHDGDRGGCVIAGSNPTDLCPTEAPRRPFISNPTRCLPAGEGFETRIHGESWLGSTDSSSFVSHLPPNYPAPPEEWGPPQGTTNCDNVPFEVNATAKPTTNRADSPSGIEFTIAMPQSENPDGIATAHLKRAEVTLPEGMSVNPASASGLGACSEAQAALDNDGPASCPDSAKLGSVEIETPLLDDPLDGSVYLAQQGTNPFKSLLALYLVAEGPGVFIKLPGKVEPNPVTGQLVTTFDDNPQLPFSEMRLRFKSGDRAPLITPSACGTYETVAKFSPWSAADPNNPRPDEVITERSSFQITSGPNGGACPDGRFAPELDAGTANPSAGQYSPFALRLTREDGTQRLAGLSATLPEGLTGKLAGIPYCPEAALAGVSGLAGSGVAQIAAPPCPAASQVGTVIAGAGAGPSPFYVDTGKAYLSGPYKGAPLSLAFLTPAVAGPFDLGSVLVRTALHVNPTTAQITAVSDPLPSILHGIPLDLRDVRVNMDRPEFTLNPTSCKEKSIAGTATSTQGASAPVSERFQAADCASLGFKPKLALKLSGKTNRSSHPRLRATLRMPGGSANIARAQVTLPKEQFLAQEHIRTICTRVQYAAKSCPKAAIYGYAKAWSPLLDQPLQGPVYLRASSNKLPDLVADLNGQIEVDLVGRIDAVNSRIRNTFELVPDAPVSKFEITMQGGRKSLLVNNTNLCKAKPRASVSYEAHSGKGYEASPLVKADCGKARKGKKRAKK